MAAHAIPAASVCERRDDFGVHQRLFALQCHVPDPKAVWDRQRLREGVRIYRAAPANVLSRAKPQKSQTAGSLQFGIRQDWALLLATIADRF
jgi:hypothetical protein